MCKFRGRRNYLPISQSIHWWYLRRCSLEWRHNELGGVSDHQPQDCLLKLLFRRRSKKTSKFRVAGVFVENSLVTGEFPHKGPMFPFDDVIMLMVLSFGQIGNEILSLLFCTFFVLKKGKNLFEIFLFIQTTQTFTFTRYENDRTQKILIILRKLYSLLIPLWKYATWKSYIILGEHNENTLQMAILLFMTSLQRLLLNEIPLFYRYNECFGVQSYIPHCNFVFITSSLNALNALLRQVPYNIYRTFDTFENHISVSSQFH